MTARRLLDPLPDVTTVRIPDRRTLYCDLCGVPMLHGVAGLVDHYTHQHPVQHSPMVGDTE